MRRYGKKGRTSPPGESSEASFVHATAPGFASRSCAWRFGMTGDCRRPASCISTGETPAVARRCALPVRRPCPPPRPSTPASLAWRMTPSPSRPFGNRPDPCTGRNGANSPVSSVFIALYADIPGRLPNTIRPSRNRRTFLHGLYANGPDFGGHIKYLELHRESDK